MMTPRESLLLHGLYDWVALDQVHRCVALSIVGSSTSRVQDAVLGLIRELVTDGLFEVGDVTAERGFAAWPDSIDDAIAKIEHYYVEASEDVNVWPWCCWFSLTSHGEGVARRLLAEYRPQL
ncbi:MAG: hypothetical protein PGN37_11320 [Mycobacterium kyogaense]|uniref:hypothetical protein n=1 Tax=Mycobacterium kyogaense TaxID=2212479 RepID=UPI002FFB91BB